MINSLQGHELPLAGIYYDAADELYSNAIELFKLKAVFGLPTIPLAEEENVSHGLLL